MSTAHPDWVKYWNDVSGRLDKFIQQRRNTDSESFLIQSLGFFSFMTEDIETKVTKNNDIIKHTFPLIVELQDLLRATLFAQRYLLLATSALHLRTAFEIRCNLKFIFNHPQPNVLAERLSSFFRYEQIVGSRLSPNLSYEGEQVEREFAKLHPYWAKKDGLLKDNADWNGEGKSLKDICDALGQQDEYFQIFKLTSKFVHGSPIVRNLYQSGKSLGCIPECKHPTIFSLLAGNNIGDCLMEYCGFFGINFPEVEYRKIQQTMLKVQEDLEN